MGSMGSSLVACLFLLALGVCRLCSATIVPEGSFSITPVEEEGYEAEEKPYDSRDNYREKDRYERDSYRERDRESYREADKYESNREYDRDYRTEYKKPNKPLTKSAGLTFKFDVPGVQIKVPALRLPGVSLKATVKQNQMPLLFRLFPFNIGLPRIKFDTGFSAGIE